MNVKKTKEIIVDFRRCKEVPRPLIMNGEEVEKVSRFTFLGIMISEDLKWEINTTHMVKKAQQRLYFLRLLKNNNLSAELLKTFYQCSIESVLTYCMTAWYANCIEKDRKSHFQAKEQFFPQGHYRTEQSCFSTPKSHSCTF